MKQWLADSDMPPSLSSERIGRVPNRNLKFLVEQKHPNVDLTKKNQGHASSERGEDEIFF